MLFFNGCFCFLDFFFRKANNVCQLCQWRYNKTKVRHNWHLLFFCRLSRECENRLRILYMCDTCNDIQDFLEEDRSLQAINGKPFVSPFDSCKPGSRIPKHIEPDLVPSIVNLLPGALVAIEETVQWELTENIKNEDGQTTTQCFILGQVSGHRCCWSDIRFER